MFELTATAVALSAGELDESVGAATSATVKFKVVLSLIPGKNCHLCRQSLLHQPLRSNFEENQNLTMGSLLPHSPKRLPH